MAQLVCAEQASTTFCGTVFIPVSLCTSRFSATFRTHFKHRLTSLPNSRKISREQRLLRIDHDVDRRLKLRPMQAEPFLAIGGACDCDSTAPPNSLLTVNPMRSPCRPALASQVKHRQVGSEVAPALLVNPLEIGVPQQADMRGETSPACRNQTG